MSQFDAVAAPMFHSFQAKPDLRPYRARPAGVDIFERNGRAAWGARESAKMNFTREDAADDLLLNEIIWRSVRGGHHPMPAPVRAAFVFTPGDEGPNPKRFMQENNMGDVWVAASYKGPGGETFSARGYLLATIPLYVQRPVQ